MNTFDRIMTDLFRREGGYVNDPADRGGATNKGITLGVLQRLGYDLNGDGVIDAEDVKLIDDELAKKIYKELYWVPAGCAKISPKLQPIYFDMVVNHGQSNAARILQHAANAVGHKLVVDGKAGPLTFAASKITPLERVVAYRILFYGKIVAKDRSQERFWFGWLRRSLEFWPGCS